MQLDATTTRLAYLAVTEHKTAGWKWWLGKNDWWWVTSDNASEAQGRSLEVDGF